MFCCLGDIGKTVNLRANQRQAGRNRFNRRYAESLVERWHDEDIGCPQIWQNSCLRSKEPNPVLNSQSFGQPLLGMAGLLASNVDVEWLEGIRQQRNRTENCFMILDCAAVSDGHDDEVFRSRPETLPCCASFKGYRESEMRNVEPVPNRDAFVPESLPLARADAFTDHSITAAEHAHEIPLAKFSEAQKATKPEGAVRGHADSLNACQLSENCKERRSAFRVNMDDVISRATKAKEASNEIQPWKKRKAAPEGDVMDSVTACAHLLSKRAHSIRGRENIALISPSAPFRKAVQNDSFHARTPKAVEHMQDGFHGSVAILYEYLRVICYGID